MKSLKLAFCALGLLTAQTIIASSCPTDVVQMRSQISTYGSITTKGCPVNQLGNGIVRVSYEASSDNNSCMAKCSYRGSNAVSCSWRLGDWGQSLACY